MSIKKAKNETDKKVIFALIIILITELSIGLVDNSILKVALNTIGFFFSQNLFISIFRAEGAVFPNKIIRKHTKVWILIIGILLTFVSLIQKVPDLLLIPTLIFLVQNSFLFFMAELRPVSKKSRNFVKLGIFLFLTSIFLLFLGDYVIEISFKSFFHILIYSLAFFLIVKGVLINRESQITQI